MNRLLFWIGQVACAAAATLGSPALLRAQANHPDMVLVPSGIYEPFFARKIAKDGLERLIPDKVRITAFWLDRAPVTNAQYLEFVTQHPEWRKTSVKPLFAEAHYLDRWPSDLNWGDATAAHQPITNVSWFAAEAYCQSHGKTLPTTDQWEYALADQGRNSNALRDKILAWYGTPNSRQLPDVESAASNGYGIAGLIGLVWEWTQDFSAAMAGPELRSSGDKNKNLFCGGSSVGVKDASDYAAFMRYSFRSSLKASYTTDNLGFRCAKEAP